MITQHRHVGDIKESHAKLATRLGNRNNYRVCGVYSPEPRAEVYCFRLNFNISNLVYYLNFLLSRLQGKRKYRSFFLNFLAITLQMVKFTEIDGNEF